MSDIYTRVIAHFGVEKQLEQLQEECGEVVTAVNHYRRGKRPLRHLLKEMEDVRNLLNQMERAFPKNVILEIRAANEQHLEELIRQ